MEDNKIFIDFVKAIHTMYLDEEEQLERLDYGKIPTKEQLEEFQKRGLNNKQISEITGWDYKKVSYYIRKYGLTKWSFIRSK